MNQPRHIAIIMDGNGRWAEQQGLPRVAGHQRGGEVVRAIIEETIRLGIPYLTLYAFSSENWRRPETEVGALMELLQYFLRRELESLCSHGVRLKVIGESDRFSPGVLAILREAVEATRGNDRLTLTLALSYGSRNEITRGVRTLARLVAEGRLAPDAITEEMIGAHLDTADIPDPDLVIRTSGEKRISNFLLWQIAYAEFHFADVCWPDFSVADLQRALQEYACRERRFGMTSAQLPCKEQHH